MFFILASCDNGNMEEVNPFIGTWEYVISGYRSIFTDTTVTVYDTNNNIYWTATYTYNETHLTVVIDTSLSHPDIIESWGETKLLPYLFYDDMLNLNTANLIRIDK